MDRSVQDRTNRLYYLNRGRCPNCGGARSIIPGAKRCEVCAARERQRKREIHDQRERDGLCTKCGRPRDDERYKTCSRCRNNDRKHYTDKRRYDRLKQSGMCVDCAERAAEAGHVLCKRCMERRKVNNRQIDPGWAKKYERRRRLIAEGLCIDCAQPTAEGRQRCQKCIEMRRDSTRKYQIIKRIKREAEEARKGRYSGR